MPAKLEELKQLFLVEATKNKALPIGGGLWMPVLHPELRVAPPYKEWTFAGNMTRMPEVTAPALGNKNNLVTIDAEIPANANGVLYALGAFSGGLTTYVKDGMLCYEYNLFEIQRTRIVSKQKLPTGKVRIEVETIYAEPKAGRSAERDPEGQWHRRGQGPSADLRAACFTANDCLDIGTDLGSPVSLDYFDKAPFAFNGKIDEVKVKYLSGNAGSRALQ